MVSGIQKAKRNSLERRILRCALAKTYSRRKVVDLLNGIHYGTRVNEESEEDSNADSDVKVEQNSEVSRKNSIKKKPSILVPHVVQKRLRGRQNDDTSKTKRPKLCAGAGRMYRTALSIIHIMQVFKPNSDTLQRSFRIYTEKCHAKNIVHIVHKHR